MGKELVVWHYLRGVLITFREMRIAFPRMKEWLLVTGQIQNLQHLVVKLF